MNYREEAGHLRQRVDSTQMAKERLADLWGRGGGSQLKPQADLALLEAKKYLKASSETNRR